jgi:glycosyltransferase involved in cell wall biosynthesis
VKSALDATPLTDLTGGLPRYTSELSIALAENFPDDEIWLLSDQPFAKPHTLAPNLKTATPTQNALERRWWLWGLPNQLRRHRIDVFHGTDFAVPYLPVRPSVLTLHDLSPWLNSAWHNSADRVRKRTPILLRLGLATMVLTPSEAIRQEAIARFHLAPDRVVSVPHAASALFRPAPPQPHPNPYFLFVGTLEPRKNLPALLNAWRAVRSHYAVDLVLIGRKRSDAPELPSLPGLHFKGPLPDEDLPAWYSGCLACAYPSFYEGFGLPVLEAMSCGAAVVTSKDPAILETGGDATIQVDARDESGWVRALSALLESPERVKEMRAKSLCRAAQFSWDRTAHLTHDVYLEAIKRFRR